MIYVILTIIIIFCGGVIIYLISKKASKLKLIAVSEIPEEKQNEVKKQLLESRLRKQLIGGWKKFGDTLRVFWKGVLTLTGRIIKVVKGRKAAQLNKRAKREIPKVEENKMPDSAWQEKFRLAEELLKKKKMEEAEEKYIEILKDDPKNIQVYLALGGIYASRKDYQTAEETYRHIMRIDPNFLPAQRALVELLAANKEWEELKKLTQYIIKNGCEEAWVYIELGLGYRKTGYTDMAEEYFERAVEMEPKNVSALDYLIEAAIINKNKLLALKAFNTLTGIEANAIKIQGYKDKIDIL
ncbi:MAG TPA: tetratricopeptide repeat protein [bacterium]|nr:tetratricopeptide repeat protein [bacterium]